MKKTRYLLFGGICSLFLFLSLALLKVDAQAATMRTSMLDLEKATADLKDDEEGWSWDYDTKTLTLCDVDIETEDEYAIQLPRTSCTIIVNGQNTLQGDYAAISCVVGPLYSDDDVGKLTVTGGGTLNMKSGIKGFQYYGEMLVKDVNLLYTGGWTFSFIRKLTLDNSYVCATGTNSYYDETYSLIGVRDEKGNEASLTLKNCYVEQGGGKIIYNKATSFIGTRLTVGSKKIIIKPGTLSKSTKISAVSTKTLKYSKDFTIIKLYWSVPKYSSGTFTVWRSTKKASGYKKIATVHRPYFKDTKRAFRKTYYYKIKAYRIGNSDITSRSAYKKIMANLKPVQEFSYLWYATKDKMTWDKVYGAQGYKIYRATSEKGTYRLIKTITKGSTTSYTAKRPNSKRKYYYKIRAYRKKNKKTYYTSYTYGYEDDPDGA